MKTRLVVFAFALFGAGSLAASTTRGPTLSPLWLPIDSPANTPHRCIHACAWDPVNDMIYMYGGRPTYGDPETTLCQRYDPSTGTWAEMASMRTPRGFIKGIYCRGKLYAMGGIGLHGATNSCEAYDIAADSWSPVASMPSKNFSYQAVVWRNSLIYVLGGERSDSNLAFDSVWVYNTSTDTWASCNRMLRGCARSDACIIGDTIYFAGGLTNPQSRATDASIRIGVINPGDPTQIAWSWGPELSPPGRYSGPTLAMNGKVYWFGGDHQYGLTALGFVYDPGSGRIDELPSYPEGVFNCCLGVARENEGELYGLAGIGAGEAPVGYHKLGLPGYYDVAVARIEAPIAEMDSGDTITPVSVVENLGRHPEGFRVMLRIEGQYAGYESTYVLPGEPARVTFPAWTANCRGQQTVKCSTMLTADNQPDNNAIVETLTVRTFDAGVSGLMLPDSIAEGDFTPVAQVTNFSHFPSDVAVNWWMLCDDTLSCYAQCESVYLPGNSSRQLWFPVWHATHGAYLAKVFLLRSGIIVRDTVQKHFVVIGAGVNGASSDEHRMTKAVPTIVNGALRMPNAVRRQRTAAGAFLLDACGRKVLELHPGANDVSRLAPGVYFVRDEQLKPKHQAQAVRKVVVTR